MSSQTGSGQGQIPGPWPYEGLPKLWPDPGPHRVRPGRPAGQQGLALLVDSVELGHAVRSSGPLAQVYIAIGMLYCI